MECIEAQRIVSERLDREDIDMELLEEAKEHCRSCSECGAFVRTLATLRMMPLPEPPADLTARIMDAVETERAVLAANSAVAFREQESEAAAPSPQAEPVSLERLSQQLRDRRHRKTLIAWAAAAAVVFVIAGIGAMAGVRQILSPTRTTSMMAGTGSPEAPAEEYGAASTEMQDATTESSTAAKQAAPAPSYIVVGPMVHLLAGEANGVDETALTKIGTTTSSLGSEQVTSHDVLTGQDPSVVYVKDPAGTLFAFERVTRTFSAKEYVLSSGAVTAYGMWPALPPGVPTPTNPDGTPEYVEAGTDSTGVTVYRPAGGDATMGIAVAPGTAAGDPAAGNPNWTWWIPTGQ